MDDPIWISKELTQAVHSRQLAEHGGLDGIRDEGMLESALARPRQQFAYAEPTLGIAALAAAYAFGIARNHPFIDDNKRTAYVICRTFLILNGFDFTASLQERYLVFVRLVAGDISEKDFVVWVEKNSARAAG